MKRLVLVPLGIVFVILFILLLAYWVGTGFTVGPFAWSGDIYSPAALLWWGQPIEVWLGWLFIFGWFATPPALCLWVNHSERHAASSP